MRLVFNDVKLLHIIAGVFPIAATLACWALYYGIPHSKGERLRTISETVVFFPENRIFAVAMTVESLLLLVIYRIRNEAIKQVTKSSTLVLQILAYLMPTGLTVLSCVTLFDHKLIHLIGATVFFMGNVVYFLISDRLIVKAGFKLGKISQLITYIILIPFFGHLYFTNAYPYNIPLYNIGSVFQYTLAILIFVKILLCLGDCPKRSVELGKPEKEQ